MDADAGFTVRDPVICVTGLGHEVLTCGSAEGGTHKSTTVGARNADPSAFLKVKKSRKFMGVQDDLAVLCAGRALQSAGLAGSALGERAGLYLAVGYIPFQEADFGPVLDASTEDGRFSMRRFAEGGYQRAHPLLTFKCLPNMPAYHVSFNFDIQGPYLVTYPGPGQLYSALEEAVFALREGRIDIAIVGGVADQRNFLVEHHFRRIDPPVPADRLRDAGGMMILETEAHAKARGAPVRARLVRLRVDYPHPPAPRSLPTEAVGPADLPIFLATALAPPPRPAGERGPGGEGHLVHHSLIAGDGIAGESSWESVGAFQ